MTERFEPHAAIRTLAEMEWPCKTIRGWVKQTGEYQDAIPIDPDEHPEDCCSGTGRIVLFKALRLEQQGVWSHRDCRSMGTCQNLLANGTPLHGITDCQGRGWVPEPDVEKACWRLVDFFWNGDKQHGGSFTWLFLNDWLVSHRYGSLQEAAISAAEAWAEEQQKEVQRGE